MQTRLTGVVDIDLEIAHHLDDISLHHLCQTNRRLYQLCQHERLWQLRTSDYLGSDYSQAKPDDITWQEWYKLWKRHPEDPIGMKLDLSLHQRGIRLWTQDGGLAKGSELFLDLGSCLERAFRLHDEGMVKYLLEIHASMLAHHPDTNNGYTLDYGFVIVSALKEKYYRFSRILYHRFLNDTTLQSWNRRPVIAKVARAIGRFNVTESFYLDLINHWDTPMIPYICGLIEGGRNDEALYGIKVNPYMFMTTDEYTDLVTVCLEFGQEKILELANSILINSYQAESREYEAYLRGFAIGAARAGQLDLVVPYEDLLTPKDLAKALAIGDPKMAIEYLQTIQTKAGLDLVTPDWELLDYCLSNRILAIPSNNASIDVLTLFCQKAESRDCLRVIIMYSLYELLPIWESKPISTSYCFDESIITKDLIVYASHQVEIRVGFGLYRRSIETNRLLQEINQTSRPEDIAILRSFLE